MSTASPDTASITLPVATTREPAMTPKRDPYVVNIPRTRTASAKIIWSIGEVMFLAAVTLIGLCLLGIILGAADADPDTAHIGDLALRALPHGAGALVASFAIRGWRHRVDKRGTCAAQGLEMLIALFASVGVGFVVDTIVRFAIMICALFIR